MNEEEVKKKSTEEFLTLFTTSAFFLVSYWVYAWCAIYTLPQQTQKYMEYFVCPLKQKMYSVSQDTTAVPVQNELITKAVVFYKFLFMFCCRWHLEFAWDFDKTMEVSKWKSQNISFWNSRDYQWSISYSFQKRNKWLENILENWIHAHQYSSITHQLKMEHFLVCHN